MSDPILYTIEDAEQLSLDEISNLYSAHINPELLNLIKLINFHRKYQRAEGCYVWDDAGNRYLDLLGAYGAVNFGHNHPRILDAVQRVMGMPNLLQAAIGVMASLLAANLARLAPGLLTRSFFGNSGAEAVEGALKLARIATGKNVFIHAENSFHGKTFGALSVTGRRKYQDPFRPLLPYTCAVPFGDEQALAERIRAEDVAAVILEPVQGEGGIILPPAGYLQQVRALCTRHGALLIMDEIQTGMGRTGRNFACQEELINPDIMCLGKSLGGGVMPLSAYITTERIWKQAYGQMDRATLHTSTFGGNTLAAAAGIASLQLLVEENLAAQAREKGEYFLRRLQELAASQDVIKEVRGRGLMIGIEFQQPEARLLNKLTGGAVRSAGEEYFASVVAGELLNQHRIITAYTLNNPNVIRIEPPLTIAPADMDYTISALQQVLASRSFAGIAFGGLKTAIKGVLR